MRPPKPVYSYLAAAGLAAVTLVTFFSFRDWGPESAVRRFHIAATQRNWSTVDQLTIEGADNRDTRALVAEIVALARTGAHFEIIGSKERRGVGVVSVEYQFPNGMSAGAAWYVRQATASQWRVDCSRTVASFQGR